MFQVKETPVVDPNGNQNIGTVCVCVYVKSSENRWNARRYNLFVC